MIRLFWRLMRWLLGVDPPDAMIDGLIRLPKVKYTDFDPFIRHRTRQRREAAQGIRGRAAAVESGAKVSDVLRMVKR